MTEHTWPVALPLVLCGLVLLILALVIYRAGRRHP